MVPFLCRSYSLLTSHIVICLVCAFSSSASIRRKTFARHARQIAVGILTFISRLSGKTSPYVACLRSVPVKTCARLLARLLWPLRKEKASCGRATLILSSIWRSHKTVDALSSRPLVPLRAGVSLTKIGNKIVWRESTTFRLPAVNINVKTTVSRYKSVMNRPFQWHSHKSSF